MIGLYCIAGADGFFGAYIQKRLLENGESVLALNHRAPVFPDGTLIENMQFELDKPECMTALSKRLSREEDVKIIYLIAAHDPDFVKREPEKAAKINREEYAFFLDAVSCAGVKKLWYSSSDTVYGENGANGDFTEEDATDPVNAYGEQKKTAEALTLDHGFTAVRFPYMFAPSLCAKKHFFDSISAKLINGERVEMFTDYIRSSLSYPRAAQLLYRLTTTESDYRVFNLCADVPSSKYDIGLLAARLAGVDSSLVVPAVMSASSVFSEKRAGTLTMSNARLKKVLRTDEKIIFSDGLCFSENKSGE